MPYCVWKYSGDWSLPLEKFIPLLLSDCYSGNWTNLYLSWVWAFSRDTVRFYVALISNIIVKAGSKFFFFQQGLESEHQEVLRNSLGFITTPPPGFWIMGDLFLLYRATMIFLGVSLLFNPTMALCTLGDFSLPLNFKGSLYCTRWKPRVPQRDFSEFF